MSEPFDGRETAALLAGLRLLQGMREGSVRTSSADMDVSIDDIETVGGSQEPLSADEIDDLCVRINCGPERR